MFLFICLNILNILNNDKSITCYALCVNEKLHESQIFALQEFYNASNNTNYWKYKWNYTALCWNQTYIPYGVATMTSFDTV